MKKAREDYVSQLILKLNRNTTPPVLSPRMKLSRNLKWLPRAIRASKRGLKLDADRLVGFSLALLCVKIIIQHKLGLIQ
jgi:hypothetical protein